MDLQYKLRSYWKWELWAKLEKRLQMGQWRQTMGQCMRCTAIPVLKCSPSTAALVQHFSTLQYAPNVMSQGTPTAHQPSITGCCIFIESITICAQCDELLHTQQSLHFLTDSLQTHITICTHCNKPLPTHCTFTKHACFLSFPTLPSGSCVYWFSCAGSFTLVVIPLFLVSRFSSFPGWSWPRNLGRINIPPSHRRGAYSTLLSLNNLPAPTRQ